jgi:lipopolysaccharide/colanic/teichoic acid biosynthesis glycosyltransferase
MEIVSPYHDSILKRFVDFTVSLVGIVLVSPLFLVLVVLVFVFSGVPVFYLQSRVGKKGKIFKIIKFRTMIVNAEKYQKKYKKYNEADGPVFKIFNDPRFTVIGRYLSRSGLDELPQFINVLRGEMSVVGPRPLPTYEAVNLPKKYRVRELINPGITSLWVINGSHNLKFKEWMKLDREYVKYGNFGTDLRVIYKTACLMLQQFFG